MTQTYQRHAILTINAPIPRSHQLSHEIYHHPTEREVAELHSSFFGNVDLWRTPKSYSSG